MLINLFRILLLSLLCVAPGAFAKQAPLQVIVGNPFLELQLFPGRGYPKFHAVEKSETLTILKSRAGWYQVETEESLVGWVHRRDMDNLTDLDGTPVDFSIPSWDEVQENRWQLGLLGGELEGVGAYNVLLGYRFTPNLSTELRYTQAFGDFSNIKLANFSLVHQAFPHWRYSPFFTVGAGVIKTFPDAILVDAQNEEDSVLTVGTGLFIYLNHKVMARLEYNKHTILTKQESNDEVDEWKAGLSVLF